MKLLRSALLLAGRLLVRTKERISNSGSDGKTSNEDVSETNSKQDSHFDQVPVEQTMRPGSIRAAHAFSADTGVHVSAEPPQQVVVSRGFSFSSHPEPDDSEPETGPRSPNIAPSGHLNLPPSKLDLQPAQPWHSRLEQSMSTGYSNPDQFKKELFRDQPPADSLSPTTSMSDSEWVESISNTGEWHRQPTRRKKELPDQKKRTLELCTNLFELFSNYARQFNAMVGFDNLKVGLTEQGGVSEKRIVRKDLALSTIEKVEYVTFQRWRVSTRTWAISARAANGVIEIFLIPTADVMLLSDGEQTFRRKLRLDLRETPQGRGWVIDGLPAHTDDLRVAAKNIFKELVRNTQENEQPIQEIPTMTELDGPLASSFNRLLAERQNLAQKVVIQQEEIQRRIARDLHDAVISDVMAIRRDLASQNSPSREQVIVALETVVQHLREICYELSPRDLGDWGLQTVLEDLLESISERTGADCSLNCDVDIPPLAAAVELHIYRIVQECLNNVVKYSQATRVILSIDLNANTLRLLIADNGKGFNPEQPQRRDAKSAGYGMTSMRERVELIRCFYPARLNLQSSPEHGTRVWLELDLTG